MRRRRFRSVREGPFIPIDPIDMANIYQPKRPIGNTFRLRICDHSSVGNGFGLKSRKNRSAPDGRKHNQDPSIQTRHGSYCSSQIIASYHCERHPIELIKLSAIRLRIKFGDAYLFHFPPEKTLGTIARLK
jgi:hypothetical protein